MEPGWLLLVPRVLVLWVLLVGVWVQGHGVNKTVSVEFGHDVNLTCRPDLEDVHWYMEACGRIRVAILRTFNKKSSSSNSFIYASDRIKYSTVAGNVLVIHNVSAGDCMVYYCGQKNNFTDEFHLLPVSTATRPTATRPTATRPTNQSEPQFWERSVLIGSLTLNGFFVVLMAGVMCRRKKSQQADDLSPPMPLSPEVPEYEEIVLTAGTPGPLAPELPCVYSKAQMPVCY